MWYRLNYEFSLVDNLSSFYQATHNIKEDYIMEIFQFIVYIVKCITKLVFAVMILLACIFHAEKPKEFFEKHRICATIVLIASILGYIFFIMDMNTMFM